MFMLLMFLMASGYSSNKSLFLMASGYSSNKSLCFAK